MANPLYKIISKFAAKEGKEKAIEKFGYAEVKKAQDSLKRAAERKRKAKEKAGSSNKKPVVKTPTSVKGERKGPVSQGTKEKQREELRQKMRERPDEAFTTVVGEGVTSAAKKKVMSPKRARKYVEEKTGETRQELEGRIGREASQMGVGTASGAPAPAKPKYKLTAPQARDAMRGKYDVEADDTEMDLVDILKSAGFKKGGKISRPRGVGKALRGYGKAMKGSK
jgi:hypothetical protein